VFNGEVGRVLAFDNDDGVVIDFEDRVATIPAAMEVTMGYRVFVAYPQRDLSLAYALTTHKCQGSEYQHVTYVINRSVTLMLNRRNFYTGVSRARKHVNLITDMRGLSLSLSVKEQRPWS
jgi:ATP-dependent exoDNAse (exonuclease V) alpha subunit